MAAGGEKTLASLALLFAIHSYRPPPPQVVRRPWPPWRCCLRSTATAPRPSSCWTRSTPRWTPPTWPAWLITSAPRRVRRSSQEGGSPSSPSSSHSRCGGGDAAFRRGIFSMRSRGRKYTPTKGPHRTPHQPMGAPHPPPCLQVTCAIPPPHCRVGGCFHRAPPSLVGVAHGEDLACSRTFTLSPPPLLPHPRRTSSTRRPMPSWEWRVTGIWPAAAPSPLTSTGLRRPTRRRRGSNTGCLRD